MRGHRSRPWPRPASSPGGRRRPRANGDATRLPFPDGTFDRIIASEVLEHIPDDARRHRRAGPGAAARRHHRRHRPAWLPERVCWALSDEYHAPFVAGGHVRIYTEAELRDKLRGAGLAPGGAHHAHAPAHARTGGCKCAVGPTNDDHPLVQAYHRLLVWDIGGASPVAVTRVADRVLNPVLGKSLVVYARKPERGATGA